MKPEMLALLQAASHDGVRPHKLPSMEWTAKLAALMEAAGLTKADVAKRIGVSQSSVGRWLGGEAHPFTPYLLPLAQLLGVPVEYLVDDALDAPPGPLLAPDEASLLEMARVVGIVEAKRRILLVGVQAPSGAAPEHLAPRPLNRPTYADQVRAGLIPDHPPESLPAEPTPEAPAKSSRKAR